MHRIILAYEGLPPELGPAAAIDITEEFTHRQWHQNVRCEWDRTRLLLYAENDWDGDAKALIDEFSDAICACIQGGFEGDIKIVAIDNAPGQK
jgi:hypothetical protein